MLNKPKFISNNCEEIAEGNNNTILPVKHQMSPKSSKIVMFGSYWT